MTCLPGEACESDGRGAFIVLTQTGLSTIQQAAPGHVDSVRRLMIDRLTSSRPRTSAGY